ncbi:MAG: ABC transporter substrate-binding protein [Acidimicrobiales bacterium]|nr:ABC transporter substrate-binding protein [Acidimicrobiales bacterium]
MMRRGMVGVIAAFGLLAAACGGGDDDGASDSADGNLIGSGLGQAVDEQQGSATTADSAESTTATTGSSVSEPTSMEEWEALWAEERAAVVKKIKDNKWGLQADGKTVLGPDGFTMDLSACASGWSNTEGLTDTEIKLGSTAPASGTQATGVYINQAMSVFFDYYADKGVFTDSMGKNRKVNQLIKDDGYDPARTIPLVDELIDGEKVFDVMTQGSPSTLKTYDKLNQRCIPHLFNSTGHPAWGDPVKHPWTNGMLLAYNIEALLWGKFIDDHIGEFPDGSITVAALVMNNDFGKVYDQAFKAYLATSANKDKITYVTEFIEPQAPTVTDAMTTLASKNPDVFIGMLTGTPCAQSATEAAQNGMNETTKYRFMPSVCKSATFVGKDVVGDAANGWWIIGGGFRDLAAQSEDANPYVKWARETLTEAGYDYKVSSFYGVGLAFGWSRAQVYAVAGQLDGGLTRANMIVALRSLDMTPAAYLWGIKANMSGNKDAYWIEGSEIAQYDSATGNWNAQGPIIELSGKSPTCAWNQTTAACE